MNFNNLISYYIISSSYTTIYNLEKSLSFESLSLTDSVAHSPCSWPVSCPQSSSCCASSWRSTWWYSWLRTGCLCVYSACWCAGRGPDRSRWLRPEFRQYCWYVGPPLRDGRDCAASSRPTRCLCRPWPSPCRCWCRPRPCVPTPEQGY